MCHSLIVAATVKRNWARGEEGDTERGESGQSKGRKCSSLPRELTPSDRKLAPDSIALDSDSGLMCLGDSPNSDTLSYTPKNDDREFSFSLVWFAHVVTSDVDSTPFAEQTPAAEQTGGGVRRSKYHLRSF